MNEWRVTFTCELVEDMHAGSGLGFRGMIDDRHARDAQGRPLLADNALAGLLRDAAEELQALGHPLATPDRIAGLFGSEGTYARARLVVRGLRFFRNQGMDPLRPTFLVVTSTAREVYSRRPLENTLRTVEMAAAGLEAKGEARLFGDEVDKEFFLLCLRRLSSVGGGKTRGAGQIRVRDVEVGEAPPLEALASPPDGPCRLLLLLRNLEPLCIPKTGFPGNIIESENYIPGSALRGAILRAISDRGCSCQEVDRLAAADVRFGNGYYLPEDLLARDGRGRICGLENLVALPLPLTAEEVKATERRAGCGEGPWWAARGETRGVWLGDTNLERDGLLPESRADREGRFKRVKSEDYLVGPADGPFFRVRPAMVTLMRNRTPAGRVERSFDSRRPTAAAARLQGPGELYSMDALAEDQLFLGEICFDSGEAARAFYQLASPLAGGAEDQADHRAWLRVGRGGSPVRVEAYTWIEPQKLEGPPRDARFTLTLTSDLIARAADLTFCTTLDGPGLAELAGLPKEAGSGVQVDTEASRSETRLIYGFNMAAGTRRAAALAIKRGSAFLITGDPDRVSPLFQQLAAIQSAGRGLGERQEEGFGRFVLNHPMHRRPQQGAAKANGSQVTRVVPPNGETAEVGQRAKREKAIQVVLDAVKEWKLAELARRKDFPSRHQWQWLRHRVEVSPDQRDLDNLFAELQEHAAKLSGRMWACPCPGRLPLWQAMQTACAQAGDFIAQRLFLTYLCRWVVRQLDRQRQERKGS